MKISQTIAKGLALFSVLASLVDGVHGNTLRGFDDERGNENHRELQVRVIDTLDFYGGTALTPIGLLGPVQQAGSAFNTIVYGVISYEENGIIIDVEFVTTERALQGIDSRIFDLVRINDNGLLVQWCRTEPNTGPILSRTDTSCITRVVIRKKDGEDFLLTNIQVGVNTAGPNRCSAGRASDINTRLLVQSSAGEQAFAPGSSFGTVVSTDTNFALDASTFQFEPFPQRGGCTGFLRLTVQYDTNDGKIPDNPGFPGPQPVFPTNPTNPTNPVPTNPTNPDGGDPTKLPDLDVPVVTPPIPPISATQSPNVIAGFPKNLVNNNFSLRGSLIADGVGRFSFSYSHDVRADLVLQSNMALINRGVLVFRASDLTLTSIDDNLNEATFTGSGYLTSRNDRVQYGYVLTVDITSKTFTLSIPGVYNSGVQSVPNLSLGVN